MTCHIEAFVAQIIFFGCYTLDH